MNVMRDNQPTVGSCGGRPDTVQVGLCCGAECDTASRATGIGLEGVRLEYAVIKDCDVERRVTCT